MGQEGNNNNNNNGEEFDPNSQSKRESPKIDADGNSGRGWIKAGIELGAYGLAWGLKKTAAPFVLGARLATEMYDHITSDTPESKEVAASIAPYFTGTPGITNPKDNSNIWETTLKNFNDARNGKSARHPLEDFEANRFTINQLHKQRVSSVQQAIDQEQILSVLNLEDTDISRIKVISDAEKEFFKKEASVQYTVRSDLYKDIRSKLAPLSQVAVFLSKNTNEDDRFIAMTKQHELIEDAMKYLQKKQGDKTYSKDEKIYIGKLFEKLTFDFQAVETVLYPLIRKEEARNYFQAIPVQGETYWEKLWGKNDFKTAPQQPINIVSSSNPNRRNVATINTQIINANGFRYEVASNFESIYNQFKIKVNESNANSNVAEHVTEPSKEEFAKFLENPDIIRMLNSQKIKDNNNASLFLYNFVKNYSNKIKVGNNQDVFDLKGFVQQHAYKEAPIIEKLNLNTWQEIKKKYQLTNQNFDEARNLLFKPSSGVPISALFVNKYSTEQIKEDPKPHYPDLGQKLKTKVEVAKERKKAQKGIEKITGKKIVKSKKMEVFPKPKRVKKIKV